MRRAPRVVLALGALAVVLVAGLALVLPRVLASDAVGARVAAAARRALGRDLRFAGLDVGLFPPSLRLERPALVGAPGEPEPCAEAERVALRLALPPLLAGAVVVDGVVMEDATLRLTRSRDGFALPGPAPTAAQAGGSPRAGPSPVAFAARDAVLRGGRVVLVDRAVAPPFTWEARDVDARLRTGSRDAPAAFDVSLRLASGGRIHARGLADRDGGLQRLVARLEDVAAAPAAAYLPESTALSGTLSGEVSLARSPGAAGGLRLVADLVLAGATLRVGEFVLEGDLDIAAERVPDAASGDLRVDATRAELRYAGVHTRPRGEPKRLTGQLVPRGDGTFTLDIETFEAGGEPEALGTPAQGASRWAGGGAQRLQDPQS